MPEFILYGFAAFLALMVFVIVWMVWRNVSPAAPGISLGYYEVLGRYAGGKLLKRIKGTLVDATSLFLNPEIEYKFKLMVVEDIKEVLKKDKMEDRSGLNNALELFQKYEVSKMCRVIVTRQKLTKHAIIQYGNVGHINEYAGTEEEHKFSFGLGFISQGAIMGDIATFPRPWNIYRIGKCQVHLFKPYARDGNKGNSPPEWMSKIALYASSTVESKELLKSMEQQLGQKDRKLLEMGKELAAASTERDALRRTLLGFGVEGGTVSAVTPKPFEITDFLLLSMPTFVCSYLAQYLNYEILAGMFVGLVAGCYLVHRRKKS
jgi:hypothetical protein